MADRAWGSLAQEVMETGLAGVLAMRYDVFADSAARFVAGLYAGLVQGRSLGEAVVCGRRDLAKDPMRSVAGRALHLADWMIPVVHEPAPLVLSPASEKASAQYRNDGGLTIPPAFDPMLPAVPTTGFVGRDEALLALDRAFDRHSAVLLHGDALTPTRTQPFRRSRPPCPPERDVSGATV